MFAKHELVVKDHETMHKYRGQVLGIVFFWATFKWLIYCRGLGFFFFFLIKGWGVEVER